MAIRIVTLAIAPLFVLVPALPAQDVSPITDTDLHIFAGAIMSLGVAAVLLHGTGEEEIPLASIAVIAGGAALLAGVGKEVVDSLGYGISELRDILNTTFGGIIGVSTVAFSFIAFPSGQSTRGAELPYAFLAISAGLSLPLLRHILSDMHPEVDAKASPF